MYDVVFHCDGGPDVGFGHVARCMALAQGLQARSPQLSIAFNGRFSPPIRERIRERAPYVKILDETDDDAERVAVIDKMPDREDPSVFDQGLFDRLSASSETVIFIASGERAPTARSNTRIVGYQLRGPQSNPPFVRWSLDYAPVFPFRLGPVARRPDSVFVGLGGGVDDPLDKVLNALRRIKRISSIDILLSPAAAEFSPPPDLQIRVHRNIPSVEPFLKTAGLVLASHGNLCFEALAAGAPLCVFGQKRFQASYADLMEEHGLAISGGFLPDVSLADIAERIDKTLDEAETLSRRGASAVDDRGLSRLVDLIGAAAGLA